MTFQSTSLARIQTRWRCSSSNQSTQRIVSIIRSMACGLGGIAGYGYGIWGPSFLMRSHNLPLAQAGLLFGLASGLGAASGAIFGGWYCDRLTRRDPRWQLRLPMIGALLGLPMGFAFLLWPAGNWQLGSLAVPHAMIFAVGFGFSSICFCKFSMSSS